MQAEPVRRSQRRQWCCVPESRAARCFLRCDPATPDFVEVTISTLDHPELFAPNHVIWLEDRLPWVALDDRLPHHVRGRSS